MLNKSVTHWDFKGLNGTTALSNPLFPVTKTLSAPSTAQTILCVNKPKRRDVFHSIISVAQSFHFFFFLFFVVWVSLSISGLWVAYILCKQNIAALLCCSTFLAHSILLSFGIDSAFTSKVYLLLVLGIFLGEIEKQIEDAHLRHNVAALQ